MKKIDRAIINVSLFLFCSFLSFAVVGDAASGIFIGFLLAVTINRTGIFLINRRKNTRNISAAQMEDRFALLGIEEQVKYLANAVPPCFNPEISGRGFVAEINCRKTFIFPDYKFSPCGMEDVAAFYRAAKEREISAVRVLTRPVSRSVLLFAGGLDVDVEFIPSGRVRKFLIKQNLLPDRPEKKPREKRAFKFALKDALGNIFTRQRAKFFLLSAISLGLLSIFAPFKIYYRAAAILLLVLALACVIRENTR